MKKWWLLVLVIILLSSFVVYSQTKPSGDPPGPFWSPRPLTAQVYINGICGGGFPEWCNWFRIHPEDVPVSYYSGSTSSSNTPNTYTPSNTEIQPQITNTTITITELRNTLINSLKDYFINPKNAKLNANEIKDLIIIYFSTSGNTIDLSGTGHYSGERLIDIYNKDIGSSACTPNCTNKCGGVSDDCGGTCNVNCQNPITPSGPLGSQTNPIPLSEPSQRIANGYVPPGSEQDLYSHGGWVTQPPPRGSILWFVIDPYAVLGRPAQAIALRWKWREVGPSISLIQNKDTGEYTPGMTLLKPQFYDENDPYKSRNYTPLGLNRYRFLWGFTNYADGDIPMKWSIWATIE
ncbi:MAG: hypothetical protein NT139_03320 [Candidatus Woesearchaeota archaeon]|nr:hypothetical protein [Candidatus Woesearchaeota archaeon]